MGEPGTLIGLSVGHWPGISHTIPSALTLAEGGRHSPNVAMQAGRQAER